MSLILDALRKADHDRKVESDAPPLDDIFSDAQTTEKQRFSPFWIAVFFLLLLLLGLAVFLLIKPAGEKSISEQSSSNISLTQKPAVEGKTTPEKTNSRSAATNTPTTSVKRNPAATEPISVDTLKNRLVDAQYRSQARENIVKNGELNAEVSRLYSSNSQAEAETKNGNTPASATSNALSTQKSAMAQARPTSKKTNVKVDPNSLLAHPDTPTIKELPLSVQGQIPTLMYTEHVYQNSGSKQVVINGKVLTERTRIAGNIVITKILSDGILLERENREFKIFARSSWINF